MQYPSYINPGGYLHVFFEKKTEEELDQLFGKNSYNLKENVPAYTIKSNGMLDIPETFTGIFNNSIIFRNGVAKVKTLYEKRMCIMRGCYDVTSEEDLEKLKNRELKKILVIRNAAFGDVLIISPLFKALKNKYPKSTIHFFGKKDTQLVVQNNPYVDAIIAPRETELGFLIQGYDEVFDLVHSIENNGYADHLNALDVLFDQLCFISEKDLSLNERKPMYFISPQEQNQAANLLARFNIDVNKDKIAYFQGEGTALARSLPPFTSLMAMRHLINLGYKIVYATHRPEARNFILLRMKGKKDIWSIEAKNLITQEHREKNEYIRLNPETGKEEIFEIHDLDSHIFYTKDIIEKTPPRDSFAMMSFASISVSVDSFYSHLAAALDIPSVIVFTNYHPYTRTRYYDKCITVTADYNKLTCGPCNGVVSECPLTPDAFPKCAAEVSIKDLIQAINLAHSGRFPIFQKDRDLPVVSVESLKTNHRDLNCRVCNSKDSEVLTSKKETIYFRCHDCSSIFAYSNHVPKFKQLDETFKNAATLNIWKKTKVQMHFEPLKSFLQDSFKPEKWKIADSFTKESSIDGVPVINLLDFTHVDQLDNSLLLINELEKAQKPIKFLCNLAKNITEGNFIAVLTPITEFLDRNPSGVHLMQPVAGLNQTIISIKALKKFFSKETGVHNDILILKGAIPCPQGSMLILEKPKRD